MPPRSGTSSAATPRGGTPSRGTWGASRGGRPVAAVLAPAAASHRSGMFQHLKRPGFGTQGRAFDIKVNAFAVTLEGGDVHHYDVVISPPGLPPRANQKLFSALQKSNPNYFTPKVSYDGQKNVYAPRELPFGPSNSHEFTLNENASNPARPEKIYTFKLTKVAKINTEVLRRFIDGTYGHDEQVLTAIMALNVAVRMGPNNDPKFTYDKRAFYDSDGKTVLGNGIEFWRGYFQSVRPSIGRMIINVDLTAAAMYQSGPLIDVAYNMVFNGFQGSQKDFRLLCRLNDEKRLTLQRLLGGVKVTVTGAGDTLRTIRGLSERGANQTWFRRDENGPQTNVAQYFASTERKLVYPEMLCVQLGQKNMIPMELCTITPGQFMRKIDERTMCEMLKFTKVDPDERLQKIRAAVEKLNHTESDYVRSMGMRVSPEALTVKMRVIEPPKLKYKGSDQMPRNGTWNMTDKTFWKPAVVPQWCLLNLDKNTDIQRTVKDIVGAAGAVGIKMNPKGFIKTIQAYNNISGEMLELGKQCYEKTKGGPTIFFVVIPDCATHLWTEVKRFGDISRGVATQCMKYSRIPKTERAAAQYWANVMLKVNVKLGGTNVIPATDMTSTPTLFIGADVMHPAPGKDSPSFASVVGNLDATAARYVARMAAQTGRQEMIDDLARMVGEIIDAHIGYRGVVEKSALPNPKRLIYFRDGVSEGQFSHVLDRELPMIKEACTAANIKPKITVVIVRKRHHNQLFPGNNAPPGARDAKNNCVAGSVLDSAIVHPTDFEFILQSHAGLLGTSRPSLYTVLYDEFGFSADDMQKLCYTLCHVYARSTRSVSIPAPVYYADIVCSRAKVHMPDGFDADNSSSKNGSSTVNNVEAYKKKFVTAHATTQRYMYFS